MSKTISIAGMGWLGLRVAQQLQTLGYQVKGSVTSIAKAETLQKSGLNVFPVEISEEGVRGEVQALLKNSDYLVILIPPGIRRNTGADYVLKMTHFLEYIVNSSVKKIILISSTSVYADEQGQVTEAIVPQPSSQSGKQLYQVEQLFTKSSQIETTIVRLGGLFGGSREPVRYLAGRTDLSGGNAPVNLIHRIDATNIIVEIIKQDLMNCVFNAVIPQHPCKKDYYSLRANQLGLDAPVFSEDQDINLYKTIQSSNIEEKLNYSFKKLLE